MGGSFEVLNLVEGSWDLIREHLLAFLASLCSFPLTLSFVSPSPSALEASELSYVSSPSGWSCAEELWLILIKPELSFRFINVTLASFLFINVTLTVNPHSLIIKVDGNHSSVCGQIAAHQQGA